MNKAKFMRLKAEITAVTHKDFICDNGGDRLGSIADFYGQEEDYRGFWCDGESGYPFKGGLPCTNYYAFDIPSMRPHYSKDGSVLDAFFDFLEERGLYCEWYVCGIIMIYEQ